MEGDDCTLTGFLRIGGELNVLGIVSVSLELELSFTYESAGNKCTGQAKLTIEIEIAFFSWSFSTTVEKEFAGGGSPRALAGTNDYSFQGMMPVKDYWDAYCEAFA
jgi:hypothetical protein